METKYKLMKFRKKRNGFEIDHINCNTLDNRDENLRFVTRSQNLMNKPVRKDSQYGYKGLYFDVQKNNWSVGIGYGKKLIYVGRFKNIVNALLARDIAERHYFKEYAFKK